MRPFLSLVLCFALVMAALATRSDRAPAQDQGRSVSDATLAQPRLIRITATVDGTDRLRFTRQALRYEHKAWSPLTDLTFMGDPWSDPTRTPPAWLEMVADLDLSRAWIVKRGGRDVIALEQTPDGFDLYLCDSPNGSAPYEVTIAVPQRP